MRPFSTGISSACSAGRAAYAIKVGFWKWVGLKARVAAQQTWERVTSDISAFETQLPLAPWNLTLRVDLPRTGGHLSL